MANFKTTISFEDEAGKTRWLCGTLSDVAAPPGSGETCPPPVEDEVDLKPGQEVRIGNPGKFDRNGCPTVVQVKTAYWPAPPANERLIMPTADTMADHAALWELPRWRLNPDGSRAWRICVGPKGAERLVSRWDDPAYGDIVKLYRDKDTALAIALQFLATGDDTRLDRAVELALAEAYSPGTNLNQLYTDAAVFVFDWCYHALTADQRERLQAFITGRMNQRFAKFAHCDFSEGNAEGYHGWVFNVIAISSEDGSDPDLARQIARLMQHYCAWLDENFGGGFDMGYPQDDPMQSILPLAYGLASDQDMADRVELFRTRPKAIQHLLSPDAKDFVAMPTDQAAKEDGYLIYAAKFTWLHLWWIADYLQDGFAQDLANRIKAAQGWSKSTSDPRWTLLMMMDDALEPGEALPLALAAPRPGVVAMRDDWGAEAPVETFFFCGFVGSHDVPKGGHIQIWRGRDELIANGTNYLGSPSDNKVNWEKYTWSHNCLAFRKPDGNDRGSSQTLTMPWQRSCEDLPTTVRLLYYATDSVVDATASTAASLIDFRHYPELKATITTADLRLCYDEAVQNYSRTIIQVGPDSILWDRWACTGIQTVHARFFSREEPRADGTTVEIRRGASAALLTALTEAGSHAVGGPGHECLIDGETWLCDGTHYCQDWLHDPTIHPDHDPRVARMAGQWVTQYDIDPSLGEFLLVIQAGSCDQKLDIFDYEVKPTERIIYIGDCMVHLPLEVGGRQPWIEAVA